MKLLGAHSASFSKREQHHQVARELTAALDSGVKDVLKFIHNAASKLLGHASYSFKAKLEIESHSYVIVSRRRWHTVDQC